MRVRLDDIQQLTWLGVLMMGMMLLQGNSRAAEVVKPEGMRRGNTTAVQTSSGTWKLAVDLANRGVKDRWFEGIQPEGKEAPAPGVIQQVLPGCHGVAWYWHSFRVVSGRATGDRLLIRFGAVDYLADVWINGRHAGTYEGGETPFEFDVTDSVRSEGENLLAVRVLNPTENPIAAAFATGNSQYAGGYGSSLLVAMYRLGEGRLILSTPYVLENLDSYPAADRLLVNLVRYAQGQAH